MKDKPSLTPQPLPEYPLRKKPSGQSVVHEAQTDEKIKKRKA
jgi:hypothetical protein